MQHSFFEWSWSLSVEEWFYLLLPLFAFILKLLRFSLKNIMLIIILGGLFIIHFFRFTYLFSINDFKYEDFEVIRYSVFYRLDGIMFGVLASYIYFYYRGFWDKNRKVMFWMGIIAFILSNFLDKVIGVNNFLYRTIELSITSITILLILPYMNSIKTSNSKLYKPITFLSITSYSLYLINSIVQMGLAKIVEYYDVNEYYNIVPWSAMFVICYTSFWGVSILLSYWFYKYYEIRATNYLRKKFLPK